MIAIINVTFYYSATLASMYASSTRRAVCIICGLYSENASETISEGLKSKISLVPLWKRYVCIYRLCPPPSKFLDLPLAINILRLKRVYIYVHMYVHVCIYLLTSHKFSYVYRMLPYTPNSPNSDEACSLLNVTDPMMLLLVS